MLFVLDDRPRPRGLAASVEAAELFPALWEPAGGRIKGGAYRKMHMSTANPILDAIKAVISTPGTGVRWMFHAVAKPITASSLVISYYECISQCNIYKQLRAHLADAADFVFVAANQRACNDNGDA